MIADETGWADPEVRAIVENAELAFSAVTTESGPHLTPHIVSIAADRLWFVTPEASIKARMLRNRPGIALTAWLPGSDMAVVLHGDAHVLDAARPLAMAGHALETLRGSLGFASYLGDNIGDTLATVRDASTGRTSIAGRRVLVGVQPDRVTLIGVRADASAALAWITPGGPIAVPGTWHDADADAFLHPDAASLLSGATISQVAVAIDQSTGTGAAQRRGSMMRGHGILRGEVVEMDVQRITTWSGTDVRTVQA